jgi:hypothetical protein
VHNFSQIPLDLRLLKAVCFQNVTETYSTVFIFAGAAIFLFNAVMHTVMCSWSYLK